MHTFGFFDILKKNRWLVMVLMIDDDDALEIYGMLVGKTAQANHFITKNTGRAELAFLQAYNIKEQVHSLATS